MVNVQKTIKGFTDQYRHWASLIVKEPRNTMGIYLKTSHGQIYMRNMARGILDERLVVCIASIELNVEYQRKGILSAIVSFIQKNPYAFKELEVENIQTEEVLNSFINKGFSATQDVSKIEIMPITVTKIINKS
jgi:hypothetical protein